MGVVVMLRGLASTITVLIPLILDEGGVGFEPTVGVQSTDAGFGDRSHKPLCQPPQFKKYGCPTGFEPASKP